MVPVIFIRFKNGKLVTLPLDQLIRPGYDAGAVDLRVIFGIIPGQILPYVLG